MKKSVISVLLFGFLSITLVVFQNCSQSIGNGSVDPPSKAVTDFELRLNSSTALVYEGDSVTLEIINRTDKAYVYTWYFGESKQSKIKTSTDLFLELEDIDMSDTGEYLVELEDAGKTITVGPIYLDVLTPAGDTQYRWLKGNCVGGSTPISCIDADGNTVNDTLCAAGNRPSNQCEGGVYKWSSTQCREGTRTVTCEDQSGTAALETQCDGTKPKETCSWFKWKATTCEDGERTVKCHNSNKKEDVADAFCVTADKPKTTCSWIRWDAGTCSNGVREVNCINANKNKMVVSESMCVEEDEPPKSCYWYKWKTTPCVFGRRSVTCINKHDDDKAVANSFCVQTDRPSTTCSN